MISKPIIHESPNFDFTNDEFLGHYHMQNVQFGQPKSETIFIILKITTIQNVITLNKHSKFGSYHFIQCID